MYVDPSGNDIEDFYPTLPNRNAPVQVKISGNTITIDAYVEITGDINTSVEDAAAHDLVIEGIKQWAGTYDNVYGHEAKVEVNVYEGHNSEGSIFPWVKKQEYLEVELINGAYTAATYHDGPKNNPDYIKMYTGKDNGEVRGKTDYANTIAHEFGHVLDVGDGYGDEKKGRPRADMLEKADMMLNNHLKDSHITDIDIQMMIIAASTGEEQSFMKYDGHVQSKGVFIYEMCDTD